MRVKGAVYSFGTGSRLTAGMEVDIMWLAAVSTVNDP
jgi:hypothetical protein